MTSPSQDIASKRAPFKVIKQTCPECSGSDVIRYGTRNGLQIYLCKPCKTRYTDNGAQPGRRIPPEEVGAAISLFYDGLSTEDVRRNFGQVFDYEPSTASVYEWIRDYSNLAETELRDAKPTKLGNTWVADEMVVRAGGEKFWIWTVMDARTRFILATHVSRTRTIRDARTLFREAKRNAGGRVPRALITDGLSSYRQPKDEVFGLRVKHIVTGSVAEESNNNLVERLNGTIRERTKVMRGMKSRKTAEELMEGWTVHYNYFRPHDSLGGKPPAQVAGAEYKLKSWEDVARLDVRPISHHRSQQERMRSAERFKFKLNRARRRVASSKPRLLGDEPAVSYRRRRVNLLGP